EVPDRAAHELLVARDRLLPPREAREALDPDPLAVVPIEEEPPGEVLLGVAERRHLPVEDGAAAGIGEDHVPDARIAPQQRPSGSPAGRWRRSQARPASMTGSGRPPAAHPR